MLKSLIEQDPDVAIQIVHAVWIFSVLAVVAWLAWRRRSHARPDHH